MNKGIEMAHVLIQLFKSIQYNHLTRMIEISDPFFHTKIEKFEEIIRRNQLTPNHIPMLWKWL